MPGAQVGTKHAAFAGLGSSKTKQDASETLRRLRYFIISFFSKGILKALFFFHLFLLVPTCSAWGGPDRIFLSFVFISPNRHGGDDDDDAAAAWAGLAAQPSTHKSTHTSMLRTGLVDAKPGGGGGVLGGGALDLSVLHVKKKQLSSELAQTAAAASNIKTKHRAREGALLILHAWLSAHRPDSVQVRGSGSRLLRQPRATRTRTGRVAEQEGEEEEEEEAEEKEEEEERESGMKQVMSALEFLLRGETAPIRDAGVLFLRFYYNR